MRRTVTTELLRLSLEDSASERDVPLLLEEMPEWPAVHMGHFYLLLLLFTCTCFGRIRVPLCNIWARVAAGVSLAHVHPSAQVS